VKCAPGCTCGRHSRTAYVGKSCPPGCECGRHEGTGSRKCEPGCTCSRHGRGACPPGCTCGKHSSEGKSHAVKCPEGCACGRHRRTRVSQEEKNRRARERYRDNVDKERDRRARYNDEHRDERREKWREYARGQRAVRGPEMERKRRHGLRLEDWARILDEQGGRCCYCRRPLDPENAKVTAVDHDHSCTCGPRKSCSACRRGIACTNCNVIVGMAHDDPDRLDSIAANFRVLAAAARERISGKPVQEELPINVTPIRRRKESA